MQADKGVGMSDQERFESVLLQAQRDIRTESLLDAGAHLALRAMNAYELEHLLSAPCLWCGYNGSGYWQEGSHDQACPWHKIGGVGEREQVLKKRAEVDEPWSMKRECESTA
jgi:hypothetical protein